MNIKHVVPYIGALLLVTSMHNTANASLDTSQVYMGTSGVGAYEFDTGDSNVYHFFPSYKGLRPYIGINGGYIEAEFGTESKYGVRDVNDEGLAVQAMLGLTFSPESMQKTEFYAGYRIFGLPSDLHLDNVVSGEEAGYYITQSVEFGVTYHF